MTVELVTPERFTPEPGRYLDVSDDVYHRTWDCLNNSTLSNLNRSAAYCRYRLDNPQPETDALAFGKAAHCAILEPERFDLVYTLDPSHPEGGYPKGWRNTKAYKEAKADLETRGRVVIKQDVFDACRWARDNIYRGQSRARDLLEASTATEVSYVADDPETGLRCKVRPDIELYGHGIAGDVKTTRDASPHAFAKSIHTFGYHRAKAFYLDTMDAEGSSKWTQYLFLVVANSAPYEIAVYDLEPEATEVGRHEVAKLKKLYAHCVEVDEWPGYSDAIQSIGLPGWAYHLEEENEQ